MSGTSPQDMDLLALEAEAMTAASVPREWREALWRAFLPADHFRPEEGHPCPGGYGA